MPRLSASKKALLLSGVCSLAANGQFLRATVSSTSWVRGEDGLMHQKVHTVEQGFQQRGDMFMKRKHDTVCFDGLCQEREMVHMQHEPSEQISAPADLVHMLQSPEWPPRGVVLMLPSQRMNPFLSVNRFSEPMLPPAAAPPAAWEYSAGAPPPPRPHMMDLAPPSVVPRPGPAEIEINLPALAACVSLAAAALLLGIATVMRVMMLGSSPAVEERPLADMAVPLAEAGAGAAAAIAMPAVPKVHKVEEPAAPAASGEEPEVAFHFKPSVGTWLVARQ